MVSLAVKTTEVIGKILTGVEFETTFITVGHAVTTVESTGNIFMFTNNSNYNCQKNCRHT